MKKTKNVESVLGSLSSNIPFAKIGSPINGILHFYDPPKTFQNYLFQLIWCTFGHGKTSGDMVGKCMPNSGPGGCPGTRVMTISGSYVDPHFPYLEYFEVYGGLQALGGISFLFSRNFTSNGVRIMSGDAFVGRVMTIFIKHVFFAKVGMVGESDPLSSDPLSSDPSLARLFNRSLIQPLARSLPRSLARLFNLISGLIQLIQV